MGFPHIIPLVINPFHRKTHGGNSSGMFPPWNSTSKAEVECESELGSSGRRWIFFFPKKNASLSKGDVSDTVDGQNPAPPRMMVIPLFIGF